MRNKHIQCAIMYIMGYVTFLTVFPDRGGGMGHQDRNSTSVALVSMLSLDGPEGLWDSSNYILAARKLAVSFRNFSDLDMVLLVVDDWALMSTGNMIALQDAGWWIQKVPGISPPHQGWFVNRYYNTKVFSKLHLWRLVAYEHVLYVDLDMLFVGDPIPMLHQPVNSTCALGMALDLGKTDYFNAGAIMVAPRLTEFDQLMRGLSSLEHNAQLAEQDYLNSYYQGRICSIPGTYNTQVSNWGQSDGVINDESYRKNGFFLSSGEPIVLIHYIGNNKPWNAQACNTGGFKLLCSFWYEASDVL